MLEKSSISNCPSDGKCETVLLKNKSLKIQTDGTGSVYYALIDDPKTSVVKFEYNQTVDTTLQDNTYKEELLFEISNELRELKIENKELNTVKMLYGKHCFCRGQAGVYKVNNGKLIVTKKENSISFETEFSIPNIDQKIKTIKATIE
uniref:hypothetical protein n=1 Tax=Flavobacterium sp. TaxID=239 RepID=UPI004049A6E7